MRGCCCRTRQHDNTITRKHTMKQEFIDQSIFRLEEALPRVVRCLNELTEAQIWQRPNDHSNSVGNLVMHLCGNVRQYIIANLGTMPDTRTRDLEFAMRDGYDRLQLIEKITEIVQQAVEVIRGMSEADLMKVRTVQGFPQTGINTIIHVVEHFSYHTGQIAFWTKLVQDIDLKFYGDMDLNVLNK